MKLTLADAGAFFSCTVGSGYLGFAAPPMTFCRRRPGLRGLSVCKVAVSNRMVLTCNLLDFSSSSEPLLIRALDACAENASLGIRSLGAPLPTSLRSVHSHGASTASVTYCQVRHSFRSRGFTPPQRLTPLQSRISCDTLPAGIRIVSETTDCFRERTHFYTLYALSPMRTHPSKNFTHR